MHKNAFIHSIKQERFHYNEFTDGRLGLCMSFISSPVFWHHYIGGIKNIHQGWEKINKVYVGNCIFLPDTCKGLHDSKKQFYFIHWAFWTYGKQSLKYWEVLCGVLQHIILHFLSCIVCRLSWALLLLTFIYISFPSSDLLFLYRACVLSLCNSPMKKLLPMTRVWTTSCFLQAAHRGTWLPPYGAIMTPCKHCALVRQPSHHVLQLAFYL